MRDKWPSAIAREAYHGLAGEIVETIEPHTEADPVAVLVQFLVAFGSIVGRSPHYRIEGDRHTSNLFAVMVGDSSKGRKGTSWGRVRELFDAVADPWANDRIVSGMSSGEGLIWAVRDEIKGMSKGAEVVLDTGIDDKRLLVLESEFASTLRVMGREGSTLSALIRQAWDRGDLRTLTKNNPAVATGAHISIIGHITKDELRRYLDRTESGNGFANRFIFVCLKRSKFLPDGGNLAEGALIPLAQRLAACIDTTRTVEAVRMNPAAREIWHAVYSKLSEGAPGLFGAVTSRGEAQVIRLAMLYALLDNTDTIETAHLQAALAVWEYSEASARFIFGTSLGDPVADEILRALLGSPDGLTRTEISGLFTRNKGAAAIGQALSVLQSAKLAECRFESAVGRPTEVWFAL